MDHACSPSAAACSSCLRWSLSVRSSSCRSVAGRCSSPARLRARLAYQRGRPTLVCRRAVRRGVHSRGRESLRLRDRMLQALACARPATWITPSTAAPPPPLLSRRVALPRRPPTSRDAALSRFASVADASTRRQSPRSPRSPRTHASALRTMSRRISRPVRRRRPTRRSRAPRMRAEPRCGVARGLPSAATVLAAAPDPCGGRAHSSAGRGCACEARMRSRLKG